MLMHVELACWNFSFLCKNMIFGCLGREKNVLWMAVINYLLESGSNKEDLGIWLDKNGYHMVEKWLKPYCMPILEKSVIHLEFKP